MPLPIACPFCSTIMHVTQTEDEWITYHCGGCMGQIVFKFTITVRPPPVPRNTVDLLVKLVQYQLTHERTE